MKEVSFLGMLWCCLSQAPAIAEEFSSVEDAVVLDEVVYQEGQNTLVIRRIEQPEESDSLGAKDKNEQTDLPLAEVTMQQQAFVIATEVYPDKKTRFRLWPTGLGPQNAMEGWSNIDWSVFQALPSIEVGNLSFRFILFQSGAEEGGIPSPVDLPDFNKGGAHYLLTSATKTDRQNGFDLLEALHELYQQERRKLHRSLRLSVEKREKRKRLIKTERKKPKTQVLTIWRHTLESE